MDLVHRGGYSNASRSSIRSSRWNTCHGRRMHNLVPIGETMNKEQLALLKALREIYTKLPDINKEDGGKKEEKM